MKAAARKFSRPKATEGIPAEEADVNALIHKGGSVAKQGSNGTEDDFKRVQLRLPTDAQQRIDVTRKNRNVKPSRHAWILEAIFEKLEREEG